MTWRRRVFENIGEPCNCLDCQAAEVTHLPIRRVPADETHDRPYWLHGDALKRWYASRDAVSRELDALRAKFGLAQKGGAV